MEHLLTTDLKFCLRENIEQHSWKILYYNVIELLKNLKIHAPNDGNSDSDKMIDYQPMYNQKGLELVENGLTYFENLLKKLEESYLFSMADFIGVNAGGMFVFFYTDFWRALFVSLIFFYFTAPLKGLQLVQWSVVTAQKFCLFMGDLYRYKEQFLNSRNFGKAKQYYVKAQQLIPTNGMPYNQLAIISLYTVC